jgi:hypothetical protein
VLADQDFLAGLGKEKILETDTIKRDYGASPVGNEKSPGL